MSASRDFEQGGPMAIANNIKPLLQELGAPLALASTVAIAAAVVLSCWDELKNLPATPSE